MKKRTYVGKPLGHTEWLLEQWGSWRMDGMGVPRYVSPSIGAAAPGGGVEYSLTDDAALMIDSVVAKLTKRNQQMGDFVWLYYGAKWPSLRIGEANRMAERKAFEIIKQGVAWIDSALEHIREAA
ncbi:antitermination protein Q [Pseudomonas mosselii]|uniref:antiterminator Q family protein n=1 Tax=Pseudomonas mosselii TaxID=78327 RepID=UPI0018D723DD|nr:antiterminator Q family protein [Pseudomonas mosselii]MBH3308975.1 antitermination protein Q [Pseudomonas mosselii]MBH3324000.1 antitermination protein Q [Pseudomonas mosselii]